jgi:hypothetical protein
LTTAPTFIEACAAAAAGTKAGWTETAAASASAAAEKNILLRKVIITPKVVPLNEVPVRLYPADLAGEAIPH